MQTPVLTWFGFLIFFFPGQARHRSEDKHRETQGFHGEEKMEGKLTLTGCSPVKDCFLEFHVKINDCEI